MQRTTMPNTDPAREIERMMEQHGTSLLRMCTLYLKDSALAEDAVQETFVKAYRALESFKGQSSERTWLTSIAIRCCLNMLRTGWFRRVDRGVSLGDLPEAGREDQPRDDSVLREIMELPEKYRAVILLFYYQDLRTSEIAQALGVSESTVSGRLRKARQRLKPRLERWLD